MKKHPITQKLFNVLLSLGFEDSYILNIEQKGDTLSAIIQLAPHCELEDLQNILQNLKQELNALDIKIGKQNGKQIEILFGMKDLSTVPFSSKYIHPNTLKIELPSSFGSCFLDFEDGASCHLLNGGAPRMGKTIFLLYLSTMLYIQTKGNIQLYLTSTKGKDFYPLMGLPNVRVSDENEDELTFLSVLEEIKEEYKRRNTLLYSSVLEKATDSKSVKELYPHMYHHFKPIFVIIDEYARFTLPAIHKLVAELVQTAGYVNVHVVITTQRPDARTTLPANIKMGLQARICFRTADKNNSIVILDKEGAEDLPTIKGRAILLDGEFNTIQVPHLNYDKCTELLNPFRKEVINHEATTNKSEERQNDKTLSNKIQNLFAQSVSKSTIQGEHQSNKCLQSSDEKNVSGWFRLASKERER